MTGKQVNIANNLLNTLGINTGSQFLSDGSFSDTLVGSSLSYITKLSKTYGTEADSGGNLKWYSASIDIVDGVQSYSIRAAVSKSLGITLSDTSSVSFR